MSRRGDDYWEGFLTGGSLVGFVWALLWFVGLVSLGGPMKPLIPPVDVWRLLDDGIEGPMRGGFYKGLKHQSGYVLTEDQIEEILRQQHNYLMNWFSETFRFGDPYDEDESDA